MVWQEVPVVMPRCRVSSSKLGLGHDQSTSWRLCRRLFLPAELHHGHGTVLSAGNALIAHAWTGSEMNCTHFVSLKSEVFVPGIRIDAGVNPVVRLSGSEQKAACLLKIHSDSSRRSIAAWVVP